MQLKIVYNSHNCTLRAGEAAVNFGVLDGECTSVSVLTKHGVPATHLTIDSEVPNTAMKIWQMLQLRGSALCGGA